MEWVTNLANQRNAIYRKRQRIARELPSIWSDFCNALDESVAQYKALYPQESLLTNGEQFRTWILKRMGEENGQPVETQALHVALDQDKQQIVSSIGGREFVCINLFLDTQDHVKLSSESRTLKYGDAAQLILQPFLFPDLPA